MNGSQLHETKQLVQNTNVENGTVGPVQRTGTDQPSTIASSGDAAKAPLRMREIGAKRVRLEIASRDRDFALFNLAIDSKLSIQSGRYSMRSIDFCIAYALSI